MNQQQTQKYNSLAACQATASQYSASWAGYTPFSGPWNEVLTFKVALESLITPHP